MPDDQPIRLPRVLREGNDAAAIDVLRAYFTRPLVKTGYLRTGAQWDRWDPSGNRARDADRFTAEDVIAVKFLSVEVPAQGALVLLGEKNDELNRLLVEVGPDRDLVEEDEEITEESAPWRLETSLREIHGIGRTIASKLIARKRPRLYPIYDTVVGLHLGTKVAHLNPIRTALRADDDALHHRLIELRERAELDDTIPALRILDVLAWMQGKGYKPIDN